METIVKKYYFWFSNWIFPFSNKQSQKLAEIKQNNIDDYITWNIYTILLPLAAFCFAFGVNLLFLIKDINDFSFDIVLQIFNNGSLPIIAFGIISSSISYLMEIIDESNNTDKDTVAFLRRKVMAISVLFLFITSSLYILQSINRDFLNLTFKQELIITICTVLVLIFSVSTGKKMFLLQKNTIQKDYSRTIRDRRDNFANGLEDL